MAVLKFSERIALSVLFLSVGVLVASDVASDLNFGSSAQHVAIEIGIGVISLLGLIWLWRQSLLSLRSNVRDLAAALGDAEAAAGRWKSEHQTLLRGLGLAIEKQFVDWNFSRSEKEIAFLLLKGLSLKEIADIRTTSERTVRQQTVAIYEKSGLGGRAELSAFFLEDLMLPLTENSNGSSTPEKKNAPMA